MTEHDLALDLLHQHLRRVEKSRNFALPSRAWTDVRWLNRNLNTLTLPDLALTWAGHPCRFLRDHWDQHAEDVARARDLDDLRHCVRAVLATL